MGEKGRRPPALGGGHEVWIVDDEAASRELLSSVFVEGGYQVEAFGEGEGVLARLAEATPSLLILDLMMPRVDGFGVLKALRAMPGRQVPPVVVLTAMTSESTMINAFELGASDVVHKPYRVTELLARVRGLLVRQARYDRLERELVRSRELETFACALRDVHPLGERMELLLGALGVRCEGVFALDDLGGMREVDGERALESWWDEELSESLRVLSLIHI